MRNRQRYNFFMKGLGEIPSVLGLSYLILRLIDLGSIRVFLFLGYYSKVRCLLYTTKKNHRMFNGVYVSITVHLDLCKLF